MSCHCNLPPAPDGSKMHSQGCAELSGPARQQRDRAEAEALVNRVVPLRPVANPPAASSHLEEMTRSAVEALTPAERAVLEKRFADEKVPAGADVLPALGSINVNGQHLMFRLAYELIKAKSGEDVRFLVVPVLDSKLVLFTFGHQKSQLQYSFPLHPEFAEQFGRLLLDAARKARGVHVNNPG